MATLFDSVDTYLPTLLTSGKCNEKIIKLWAANFRDLETQLLCDTNGERVSSTRLTDGKGQTWGPIRWPRRAKTEKAYFNDPTKSFSLAEHLVAVGSTGWDWKNKASRWVGFDFDSLIGHATGANSEYLEKIAEEAPDYCYVSTSTRGLGRHLYVFFDPEDAPTTKTHTEHAALSKAVLEMLINATSFDFKVGLDVCGQVLWFYSTDAAKGFTPIKDSVHLLKAADLPLDWEANIAVMEGKRARVQVLGYDAEESDKVDDFSANQPKVNLDPVHKKILDMLDDSGFTSVWVHDHGLCQTHSGGLKVVFDKLKDEGRPLKGWFDTISDSDDPGKPNCFLRPAPDGAFDVYRFGKGTPEHALWRRSESWTYIKYNAPVNFVSVCENLGGKRSKPGGFKFTSLDKAREAAGMLGAELTLPDISPTDIEKRGIVLGRRGKDAIGVFIRKVQGDREMFFDGWECEKGYWGLEQDSEETHVEVLTDQDVHTLDSEVRAVVIGGLEGINSSWHLLTTSEQWVNYRSSEINCVVNAWASDRSSNPGGSRELSDRFKAWAVRNPWKAVSLPFEAEYPGGRVWNRGAPQFRYQPVDKAVESIKTPHWDLVLEHCGRYLTPQLRQQDWTSEFNIATGGDYLKAWIACLFRHPFDKLPYLFMYGPSGGGKSIFAEAVDLLVTCGVDGADNALTNPQGFNGELAHSILGVVDETNLSSNSTIAYNRIKDWSTALTINIHKKGLQIYQQPNSLHFCQFSNTLRALDIPPVDTRITPVYVAKPDTEIPKGILLDALQAEASHFMRYLVDLNLPAPRTRLRLPFVSIPEAERRVYEDPLNFIECVYAHVDGAKEKLEDVYCHFFTCLPERHQQSWDYDSFCDIVKTAHPVGQACYKSGTRALHIGNICYGRKVEPGKPLKKVAGSLKDEN